MSVHLNLTCILTYRQYKKFINLSDKTHKRDKIDSPTAVRINSQCNQQQLLLLMDIFRVQVTRRTGVTAQTTVHVFPLHLVFPDQILAGSVRVHS
jgi:hypothetical protein